MHLKKLESLGSSNEGSIRFICSIIFGVNIGLQTKYLLPVCTHISLFFFRNTDRTQIKEGLDHHTRVACAQIRNASELLWHDFVRGQRTHIELFWENAVCHVHLDLPPGNLLMLRI
jgi:hypothetical protein